MFALISAIGCFEIFRRIDSRAVGVALIALLALSFIGNPTFSIKGGGQMGKTPINIQVMPVAGNQNFSNETTSYQLPPRQIDGQTTESENRPYFDGNMRHQILKISKEHYPKDRYSR